MKKRVISWLLCLALCLSMLPMAALAEDVQAPEGPAPSLNEPQPEPRAKENETPTPEPEKKVQPELMTAEKLLMPLAEDTPFTISFTATQNGNLITDEKPGVLSGGEVTLTVRIHLSDVSLRNDIIKAAQQSTLQVDNNNITFAGVGTEVNDTLVITITFAASSESHSVKYLITYNNQETTAECTLRFGVCSHLEAIEVNGKFKCTECGAALVAELTAGESSSATYYDTLEAALNAAQEADAGSTVTLLADCSLGSYELRKGSFMLDLDGHTLTQLGNPLWVSGTANLTVKNDRSGADYNGRFYLQSKTATLSLTIGSKYAKIMSDSSVGYILGPDMGYKVNGNWATLPQLYRTYIENVTVAKYRFSTSDITVSPEDAYVNREVTLSVKLNGLADGSGATCDYYVDTSASSGTTNSERIGTFNLDANQTFTTAYTPKVSECTIRAQIKYGDFYVIKKLEKKFNTCEHDRVNQDTGYCRKCKSQMAASVSPSALVGQRTYYETFDLAMNAAWDMLKSQDCWFTMFQDATVGGALNNEYVTGGHTLYMVMNGKTLTSSGTVFSVPKDRWKLNFRAVGDSPGGTLIGESRDWGTIYVQYGGSLEIGSGKYTIQNTYSDTAPSIVVHGSYGTYYTPGIATIYASEDSDLGNLLIMSGQVTVYGGTFKNATVSAPGGRLTVSSGRFTGNVIVNPNAWFYAGSSQAYFDGTVTINSDGGATLDGGNYKHLKVDGGRTLGSFMPNTLDMFKMGDVYLPHARSQFELTAVEDKYITIVRHTQHEYDEKGICSICNTQAEAKLYPEDGNYNKYEYGTIWQMLNKAQETQGSCLVLLKDITLNSDTTISEGNFALSLGRWHLRCADSQNEIALVINGGEISIKDGTFDRLKVTDTGKLTLNGGKYYAIDVADSTYANYGQLLPGGYAFKTSSGWEAKGDITEESFASDTAKEVKILPLRSVEISPAASAVAFGTSVTFTATPSHTDGATYQWYRNGVAIQDATTNTLVVNESVGDYTYRCDVTRNGYTMSATAQLSVNCVNLSSAALSATIAERAYDGTTNATVTSSSIGSSGLTANTDYTISSAEFEDANAGKGKKVTVKVKLTNPNYCFGYESDGTPILEKTFETTGTITQNITPIVKDKTIEVYSGIAHTYTVDLDACLSNLQDLGFEGYQITEKDIVVSKLIDANQVVLEGHSLKIPVNAVVTAPGTVAAKFTIAVACKNYSNVTILVRVETKDRSTVTATATPSKSKLTYGEKLDTIALSGTTDPMIPGTFAWQTPDAILDAGRHADLVWKFIPADYTYAEASGTAEITVKQAKLTDPAPVTLTIYNGWAGTYEAALPELPALAEGLYFGKNTAYGEPDVSAGEYYSSGAELKTVNGKQGVSIPILKNETAKEGKVGTITVQYTSQNYEPVTLAINLVARNRTAPTFILTADHDTLSGGGKVTLTLERGNLPDGAVVTVSGTDEAGNAVTMTDNGDGTYSATLPNKTQTYTFIAAYDGSQTIAPKTDFTTVKVQQRSSGGGEPAKPSFPVKIANSGDGVAKVDKSYASAGAKVTITVTPGRNATVQRITVTDEDGQRLKLTENRDGTYSFTMPSGTANVYVRFSGSGLPFADVPSGSWYYDDVAYVYDTGLMTGLTATAFGPNLSTTRGMIVTILWRMENEPAAKHGCPFADVRRGSYYEQAIAWASENGIVTGFDASTFAPDRAITREQLAAILFRFAAYRGMDAVTLRENLSSFQDQAAISAYAVSALNWAVGEGLMQGTGDKLEPTGSATRAQVAAMLRRFIQRNF
jgi:hypothetical protein